MDTGYRCKNMYCGKKLKHRQTFKKHEASHRENFHKMNAGEVNNLKHESSRTEDKPFSCKQCSFKTKYRKNLVRHSLVHSDLKNYRCVLCSFQTKWKANLLMHIKSHTNQRPFSCFLCGKAFKMKRNLQRHLIIHSPLKLFQFQCDECSFRAKTKYQIKDHKLRIHSDVRAFSCTHPGCSRTFKTKSDVIRHMVVHITSTTNNCVCGICGNTFKGKYSLNRHQKKEKCLTCDSHLNLNGYSKHCSKNYSCTCQYCKIFCKKTIQTTTDYKYLQQIGDKGPLDSPNPYGCTVSTRPTTCQSIDDVEKDIFHRGLSKQYGLTKCVVKLEKLATDNNLSHVQDIHDIGTGVVSRAIKDMGEDFSQQNLRVSDEVFNNMVHVDEGLAKNSSLTSNYRIELVENGDNEQVSSDRSKGIKKRGLPLQNFMPEKRKTGDNSCQQSFELNFQTQPVLTLDEETKKMGQFSADSTKTVSLTKQKNPRGDLWSCVRGLKNQHNSCQKFSSLAKKYDSKNKQGLGCTSDNLISSLSEVESPSVRKRKVQDLNDTEKTTVIRNLSDKAKTYMESSRNKTRHKNAEKTCSSSAINEKSSTASSKYCSYQEEVIFPAVVGNNKYGATESRNFPSSFSKSKTRNEKQKHENNRISRLHLTHTLTLDKAGYNYKVTPDLCITRSTSSSNTTNGRNNFVLSPEFDSEGPLQVQVANCDVERGHRDRHENQNLVPNKQTENGAQHAANSGIKHHRNIFQLLDKQLKRVSSDSEDRDDLSWSSYKGNHSPKKSRQKIRQDDQVHLQWSEQDGNVVSKLSQALSMLGYSLSDDGEIVKLCDFRVGHKSEKQTLGSLIKRKNDKPVKLGLGT